MSVRHTVVYIDQVEDVSYSIDSTKFSRLHERTRRAVMKTVLEIHDQHTESATQIAELPRAVSRSVPVGGFTHPRPFGGPKRPCIEQSPKKTEFKFSNDLGIFPTKDFRYSMNMAFDPVNYRIEPTLPPVPRPLACPNMPVPPNMLMGNVAVLRRNTNTHSFVAAAGLYPSQNPSQSIFSYICGTTFDQCYQIMRNGYQ